MASLSLCSELRPVAETAAAASCCVRKANQQLHKHQRRVFEATILGKCADRCANVCVCIIDGRAQYNDG